MPAKRPTPEEFAALRQGIATHPAFAGFRDALRRWVAKKAKKEAARV